jgi:hypothetical protein
MRNVKHLKVQDYDAEPAVDQNVAEFANRKLALFAQNCRVFAERVAVGQLRLIDAADMLQSAAELSGLCEMVGDDAIQRTMADAFTACPGCQFS